MKNIFTTIRQAEIVASKKIRSGTFRWVQAAAEDGFTAKKNILDLNNIQILPKQLCSVNKPKILTKIFNKNIISPLLLSPMGHQTQFHKKGEIETAKGVNAAKTASFFATQGRMSLDDIRKNNKDSKISWTIFPFGDENWIMNEIENAEKNNCFSIVLCIDANIRSHRYLDRETITYDARKFGTRTNPISPSPDFALKYNWNLINKIRKKTKKPLIIKGILTAEDAMKAINHGADAIWISNHGGRMLNSGISGVTALIEIKKKIKSNNVKIIVDGGIRRGSDIIKYLCLGADYVGVGRPAMYGLICDGHKGVEKIFNILNQELYTAMINGGFKDLKSFNLKRIRFEKKN